MQVLLCILYTPTVVNAAIQDRDNLHMAIREVTNNLDLAKKENNDIPNKYNWKTTTSKLNWSWGTEQGVSKMTTSP